MKDNFDRALARVLVYEGGFSNNPADPGGATMRGITQATYNSWLARQGKAPSAVKGIAMDEVMAIYKADYWDRIEADDLPSGVDFCMFDAAVNSGVGGATKWAQAVVSINVDGDFGPKTKAAILADDPEDFIHDFCARRLGTLQRLKTWGVFGKGWAARISNVQKIALAWAQATLGPDPIQADTVGGNAKARPADVPVSRTGQIVTHVTTVGGAVATGAAQAGQSLAPTSDVFSWMKYILGALTVLGAVAGLVVYFAKQADDAATGAARKVAVDPEADTTVPTAPAIIQRVVQATGVAVGVSRG